MSWEESWSHLQESAVRALPQIVTGAVLFLVFWIAAGIVGRIVVRVGVGRGVDPDLMAFLGRMGRVTLLLFGTVTALGTIGVNVAALVAGLGLTGFALGFALKDIISNVLAGVLLLIYKPFRREDRISVSSFEGTVREIDLRYTVLDTEDRIVYIPNSRLFTDPITVARRPGP